MEKACYLVEGEAKRICPVDIGRARASITHEVEKSGNEVLGRVGSNVEYFIYFEYGIRYQSAQPTFRPALHHNKGRIRRILAS
jgi:HK97 gp10 family phage protein